ncbi:hypothetical protein [Streptomyces sp. NPDC059850]|uniref:hypothetical protein n=1 Tax=Streptomyces sp. NPDC059850 TaxID=3346970 RepID=UPI003668DEE7
MSMRGRRPELPAGPAAEEEPDRARPEEPEAKGTGPDEDEPDRFDDDEDGFDYQSPYGGLDELLGRLSAEDRTLFIHAPNGNINAGSVHGGQHVKNDDHASGPGGRRVEAREGPISADEILGAGLGFAEPDWFPTALGKLDTRVLFLTGAPGTGRRTAALNLLHRHSGSSMALRAVDSDMNLATWRPTHPEARGYLVDGLLPKYPLRPGMVGNLRRLLDEADARMVIVLPDDPELVRSLERDLHVTPVPCRPAPPRAVFEARLEAAVPDPARRGRLLGNLEPGLLEELLVPELMPAEVAELVATVVASGEDGTDPASLRNRLSFLAEGEVPDLIGKLVDDADGLAFLLATCVFEGLDHRIVREESERLLELAEGRLSSVQPPSDDRAGDQGPQQPRSNPHFVFRRSLEDLLRSVRAQCAPKETRTTSGYTYAVEPVRFTRHRQAETVLRYVWREYGQLAGVLTDWMDAVKNEGELTRPVGRVMGMAAGWGGGRRALRHIGTLAKSDRNSSRIIAAYAMGVAAKDPVLASEVKHRLLRWSGARSQQLRSTVAYTCGTEFGLARPDLAMRLLRGLYHGIDDEQEPTLRWAVRSALGDLFSSGNEMLVFRQLAEWASGGGADADLALRNFPYLLHNAAWFIGELLHDGETAKQIVDLIRRALDDDDTFDTTCRYLIQWCGMAAWNEQQKDAVEALLTALARTMRHGVLRLFVVIDRHEETPELAGRDIARETLSAWRAGGPTPWRSDGDRTPTGGHRDF